MTDGTKLAVVTGANRGIGREIARQLAARGDFRVVATSRDPEATALANTDSLPLDVSDRASIDRLRDAIDGPIDVLINNAAIALDGFDAVVVRRTLDVNFYGPMHLTDALAPKMHAGSRIVNVSSGVGALDGFPEHIGKRLGDPKLDRNALTTLVESFHADVRGGVHTARGWPSSAYRVSKAALNALTRILSQELRVRGIAVCAMCPGWVATDMGGPNAPRTVEQGADTAVWLAAEAEPRAIDGRWFRDRQPIPF